MGESDQGFWRKGGRLIHGTTCSRAWIMILVFVRPAKLAAIAGRTRPIVIMFNVGWPSTTGSGYWQLKKSSTYILESVYVDAF